MEDYRAHFSPLLRRFITLFRAVAPCELLRYLETSSRSMDRAASLFFHHSMMKSLVRTRKNQITAVLLVLLSFGTLDEVGLGDLYLV